MKPRLKARASDLSLFFNYIKDEVLRDYPEKIGDIISDVLRQTSVTAVKSMDTPQPSSPNRIKYDDVEAKINQLKFLGINDLDIQSYRQLVEPLTLEVMKGRNTKINFAKTATTFYDNGLKAKADRLQVYIVNPNRTKRGMTIAIRDSTGDIDNLLHKIKNEYGVIVADHVYIIDPSEEDPDKTRRLEFKPDLCACIGHKNYCMLMSSLASYLIKAVDSRQNLVS